MEWSGIGTAIALMIYDVLAPFLCAASIILPPPFGKTHHTNCTFHVNALKKNAHNFLIYWVGRKDALAEIGTEEEM